MAAMFYYIILYGLNILEFAKLDLLGSLHFVL